MSQPSEIALRGFDLQDVRLLPGPMLELQRRNARYLLNLDLDRLLHNFRINAGLPSSAVPLGGWEAPTCGLRGHFVGHYLSACAQNYASLGDDAFRSRVTHAVHELAICQDRAGSGFLAAIPESDLDAIETKFEGAWASYYILHKVLAGLVDAYRLCGLDEALRVALRLADYIERRIAAIPPERLEPMLRTDQKPNPTNEFGGMSEVLQDLHDITDDSRFDHLARVFDREWFLRPLLEKEDRLTGLHANTHIPMALGLAKRYERTGDDRLRAAVAYFWERTALARSYVNGGSSGPRPDGAEMSKGGEHWPAPFKLASTLTPKINESCVAHNMLRLTDSLFRWTADPRYAEFYERAYFNSVLSMQHWTEEGRYLYDHPLASGSKKVFGTACDSFWCCYGSTVEAFAKLGSGIYYQDDEALWVNLPVPSRVEWRSKSLQLTQQTRFPDEPGSTISFACAAPVAAAIQLRVPMWAEQGLTASVNGQPLALAGVPGSFMRIHRTWCDGDVLEWSAPLSLHVVAMPDDPSLVALLSGPMVLAARTECPLVVDAGDAVKLLASVVGGAPPFRLQLASGDWVELVYLNQIVEEPFGVYFRTKQR